MPGKLLTDSDRQRLSNFPSEISKDDLSIYFTLSSNDMDLVKECRGDYSRIGFAVQLGALRYLGFCPDNFNSIPFIIVEYIASQLNIIPSLEFTKFYGDRKQTRTDHLIIIQDYLEIILDNEKRLKRF